MRKTGIVPPPPGFEQSLKPAKATLTANSYPVCYNFSSLDINGINKQPLMNSIKSYRKEYSPGSAFWSSSDHGSCISKNSKSSFPHRSTDYVKLQEQYSDEQLASRRKIVFDSPFSISKRSSDISCKSLYPLSDQLQDQSEPPHGASPSINLCTDGSNGYGDANFSSRVLDVSTAPEKKKGKWFFIWSNLSDTSISRIQMDEVACFSVTDMRTADRMSRAILTLDGISENSIITDCTACVGGNTISLARYFRHVNAIEIEPKRLRMLENNVGVCIQHQTSQSSTNDVGTCNHDALDETSSFSSNVVKPEIKPIIGDIRTYVGDCIKVCPNLKQDIVFMDPPWGGEGYCEHENITLYLSGKSLLEVCLRLILHAKFICLKLPYNVDLQSLSSELFELVQLEKLTKKIIFIVLRRRIDIGI